MGGMGETLAALFIPLALFALALWGLQRWFRRLEPAGVVVESETELEAVAPVIGTYHGDEIHDWVRYRGERYEFSHIAPPRYRLQVKANELFLAPGVVYRKV
jgi:hypothetical protein